MGLMLKRRVAQAQISIHITVIVSFVHRKLSHTVIISLMSC